MNVKASLIFFTVLLFSSIACPAYSLNICEEGRKGLTETFATYNGYFSSYVKNHNASGYAYIREVVPSERGSEYYLTLDCGNDVLLQTISRSGFLRDLTIKQEVLFSGEVKSWRKTFYRNSDKYYIEITLGESSISW